MKTVLVFLICLPFLAFSQQDPAKKQIRDLKNTILLVRLNSTSEKIENLKANGDLVKSAKMQEKLKEDHQKIAAAFTERFKFCPVYFFYSESDEAIRQMHLGGNLLDERLEPVNSIARPVPIFYVAQFGRLRATGDAEKSGAGTRGLFILDSHFAQLAEPFPYIVRTCSLNGCNKKAVKKLDKQLDEFYKASAASH